ncbi:MAG: hypothetical protein ACRYGG_14440 [Janthinobacterium lividum]
MENNRLVTSLDVSEFYNPGDVVTNETLKGFIHYQEFLTMNGVNALFNLCLKQAKKYNDGDFASETIIIRKRIARNLQTIDKLISDYKLLINKFIVAFNNYNQMPPGDLDHVHKQMTKVDDNIKTLKSKYEAEHVKVMQLRDKVISIGTLKRFYPLPHIKNISVRIDKSRRVGNKSDYKKYNQIMIKEYTLLIKYLKGGAEADLKRLETFYSCYSREALDTIHTIFYKDEQLWKYFLALKRGQENIDYNILIKLFFKSIKESGNVHFHNDLLLTVKNDPKFWKAALKNIIQNPHLLELNNSDRTFSIGQVTFDASRRFEDLYSLAQI